MKGLAVALEWVFPPKCALCGAMGEPAVCPGCAATLEPLPLEAVAAPSPLSTRAAVFRYSGRAAQAVKRLKYERSTSLARFMAERAYEAACALELLRFDLFVPVPIHWRRRCLRGFNQSELIAEGFAAERVTPGLLRRIRHTRPQVGLTPDQRLTNLRGAFRARPGVKGRRVLLIDDVLTSGGTAVACAEALTVAGAREVAVLTFAGWGRGDPDWRA